MRVKGPQRRTHGLTCPVAGFVLAAAMAAATAAPPNRSPNSPSPPTRLRQELLPCTPSPHSAPPPGALATLFGILEVLPVAAYLLPARIRDDVMAHLPDSAGMAILQVTASPAQLPPWIGFGVFTSYTAIALLAASMLLRRRDT